MARSIYKFSYLKKYVCGSKHIQFLNKCVPLHNNSIKTQTNTQKSAQSQIIIIISNQSNIPFQHSFISSFSSILANKILRKIQFIKVLDNVGVIWAASHLNKFR